MNLPIRILHVVQHWKRSDPWVAVYTPDWEKAFDLTDDELEQIPIVQKIKLKGFDLDKLGKYRNFCAYLMRHNGIAVGDVRFSDPIAIPNKQ